MKVTTWIQFYILPTKRCTCFNLFALNWKICIEQEQDQPTEQEADAAKQNDLEPATEVVEGRDIDPDQEEAAIKIQAGLRGYRDRQRVKALRVCDKACCKYYIPFLALLHVCLCVELIIVFLWWVNLPLKARLISLFGLHRFGQIDF